MPMPTGKDFGLDIHCSIDFLGFHGTVYNLLESGWDIRCSMNDRMDYSGGIHASIVMVHKSTRIEMYSSLLLPMVILQSSTCFRQGVIPVRNVNISIRYISHEIKIPIQDSFTFHKPQIGKFFPTNSYEYEFIPIHNLFSEEDTVNDNDLIITQEKKPTVIQLLKQIRELQIPKDRERIKEELKEEGRIEARIITLNNHRRKDAKR